MRFFDFNSNKPKITEQEFKKAREGMAADGLSKKDRDEVEGAFRGDLHEGSALEKGISAEEMERGIQWLREHKNTHPLSGHDIDIVEKQLKKRL